MQSILDQYDDLGKIDHFFLYTSGYENSNYYIKTQKGQYVVKIFEGIGVRANNILFELEVMNFSHQSGIKTPSALRNSQGKLATVINQKYVCLMDFVEGDNMDKRALSDELVAEVGREAGRMDIAFKRFKNEGQTRKDYEWDMKSALLFEKSLPLLPSGFDQKIFEQIFEEFKKIYPRFIKMPTGLIHNDIVPHNWLVKDEKLNSIIDFSDIEFSPYIQNVAVALHLISFAYNYNPNQAKIFIENYREFNPLTGDEIGLLYLLIKIRFMSFVIGCNLWNRKYGVHEQWVEAVNDNYKFLRRFIDFGQKKFDKLINF